MDEFHILTTSGTGYYYDYDGTNGQPFASGLNDMPGTLSANGKYLYYFTPSGSGSNLSRVQLTGN